MRRIPQQTAIEPETLRPAKVHTSAGRNVSFALSEAAVSL